MAKHEQELQEQAAEDAAITAERIASERAAATAALLEETHRAVARGASAAEEHALLQRGRALTSTLPVQQSLAMQAELEEVRWLLARNRQARQQEQKKKRAKLKHRRLAARRRAHLSRLKHALEQLQKSSVRCNCHDFACWQHVWRTDPAVASRLRELGHHLPDCTLSVYKETFDPLLQQVPRCPSTGMPLMVPGEARFLKCASLTFAIMAAFSVGLG